jgi:hypothetical protein
MSFSYLPCVLHGPNNLNFLYFIAQLLVKVTNYEALHYAVSFRSPITTSLYRKTIILSTLLSNTLVVCFSFSVTDQVPHSYKQVTLQFCKFKPLRFKRETEKTGRQNIPK